MGTYRQVYTHRIYAYILEYVPMEGFPQAIHASAVKYPHSCHTNTHAELRSPGLHIRTNAAHSRFFLALPYPDAPMNYDYCNRAITILSTYLNHGACTHTHSEWNLFTFRLTQPYTAPANIDGTKNVTTLLCSVGCAFFTAQAHMRQ